MMHCLTFHHMHQPFTIDPQATAAQLEGGGGGGGGSHDGRDQDATLRMRARAVSVKRRAQTLSLGTSNRRTSSVMVATTTQILSSCTFPKLHQRLRQ